MTTARRYWFSFFCRKTFSSLKVCKWEYPNILYFRTVWLLSLVLFLVFHFWPLPSCICWVCTHMLHVVLSKPLQMFRCSLFEVQRNFNDCCTAELSGTVSLNLSCLSTEGRDYQCLPICATVSVFRRKSSNVCQIIEQSEAKSFEEKGRGNGSGRSSAQFAEHQLHRFRTPLC